MGRRYVVTTLVREAPEGAVTGRVYDVDLESGRVLGVVPVPETPWRSEGTNPRGGHRGARGIVAVDGRLALSNADEVHVLGPDWRTLDVLSHPLVGDIHALAPAADGLWVSSTRSDSVVHLGWDGAVRETWSWRDDPGLVELFGYRNVAAIDRSVDYRSMRGVDVDAVDLSHVNAALPLEDGLLVSLGRVRFPSPSPRERVLAGLGAGARAAIVGRPLAGRLRAERIRRFGADPRPGTGRRGVVVHVRPGRPAKVVVQRRLPGWPIHDLVEHGREIVLCDTSRGLVVAVDRATREERAVRVGEPESFVRGLAPLGGDRFLVGAGRPTALHLADLGSGRVEHLVDLSDETNEFVYDLEPLPDGWRGLPASLGR